MRVTFRQGIARFQTDVNGQPTFLQKSSLNAQFIDLNVSPDPTVIIFAHKNATYVYEEPKTVRNAWGPFTAGQTRYLFWDIDLLTGVLTRGSTLHPPMYTGVSPTSPVSDQHWFDTTQNQMRVWNGLKWIDKIRVFAATYTSSAIIKPQGLGSQAGLNEEIDAGSILLDAFNKPLRQSDGSFTTSASNLSVVGLATQKIKFDAAIIQLMANEYMPMFSAIQIQEGRRAILGRSSDIMSRVVGVITEDLYAGEVGNVVPAGLIRYDGWTWPTSSISRPLFCGLTGELTLVPPVIGVLQQVGYVHDTDCIYVDIRSPIILDDIFDGTTPPPDVNPLAPVAAFSATPLITSGTVPFTVTFQDTSLNSPTSIEWDFTNDGSVDGTTSPISYTYSTPGTYDVRLRAFNAFGQDDEVKTGYITVAPALPSGVNTNLEVKIIAADQVVRGSYVPVSIQIKNDGFETATNIVRTITILDVDANQIIVSGLPGGSTTSRDRKVLTITLPTILSMITSGVVSTTFTVQAPLTGTPIVITATVSSPEIDSESGDNTASLSIEVKPQ
jgi:PKD repeat protein